MSVCFRVGLAGVSRKTKAAGCSSACSTAARSPVSTKLGLDAMAFEEFARQAHRSSVHDLGTKDAARAIRAGNARQEQGADGGHAGGEGYGGRGLFEGAECRFEPCDRGVRRAAVGEALVDAQASLSKSGRLVNRRDHRAPFHRRVGRPRGSNGWRSLLGVGFRSGCSRGFGVTWIEFSSSLLGRFAGGGGGDPGEASRFRRESIVSRFWISVRSYRHPGSACACS